METHTSFGRRKLIAGAGAAAIATTALARPAGAVDGKAPVLKKPDGGKMPAMMSAPRPIPGGVDSGAETVGFIHWWLPGPEGKPTQILEIPGFGLDVDPSTITDFKGKVALAVVAGKVKGSDGKVLDCEFDVRVMDGQYIAEDGKKRYGVFAFL